MSESAHKGPAMIRVAADYLKSFTVDVFKAEGVPAEDAGIVADNLVQANLRGVDSHGVIRVSTYIKRLRDGGTSRVTPLETVSESPSLVMMDAKNGIGQVASYHAMKAAVQRAKETGIAAVGVRNSNHFGMAAYFSMMALDHDMIGFAMSNTNINMTTGTSARPGVGNNPWSVAIPAGKELPIVIDMASSIVAAGKLMNAIAKGERVPLGWGVDSEGKLTDDPDKIYHGGSLLPFGGYKGYSIALMLDVLSGVLTGSGFGRAIPRAGADTAKPTNVGHFFVAINVRQSMDVPTFKARVDSLIADIKALPPMEGVDRVRIPGEIEFEVHKERTQDGIPLPAAVIEDLKKTGETLGVEFKI